MSDRTKIEWTRSDDGTPGATWNPVTGWSPGCDHCYAKTFAERWRGTEGHYFEQGFDVQLRPDKLDQPLRWKKPRKIFVNSMSDLFHDQVPDGYIARVFAIMALAPQHTFQVLTKRHGRMRTLLRSDAFWKAADISRGSSVARLDGNGNPTLTNVWLGVSAENQQWANIRIPALLGTPAAVRFVSAEPLLGPISLSKAIEPNFARSGWKDLSRLHWVIAGGESGHGARPMHPEWARSLRDECTSAGVAFLFKQWGEYRPATMADGWERVKHVCAKPRCAGMWRAGKKAAGRELDGRTWDEYPEAVADA